MGERKKGKRLPAGMSHREAMRRAEARGKEASRALNEGLDRVAAAIDKLPERSAVYASGFAARDVVRALKERK